MLRGSRIFTFVTGDFSTYGWCISLKNETARTISIELSNNLVKPNHRPSLIETDGEREVFKTFHRLFYWKKKHWIVY